MGQLTFQATLGGSVNLIGPNTVATTNLTLPAADGSSGQALTTNGSGTLAFANIPLASAVSGTLPIANGGTNSTATATAGGVGYGTGTAHAYTAAGTSGYFLQSNGASAPSWASIASGLSAASQAEMEAASSNTVAATPLNTKWHPGVAKVWLRATNTGSAISASYNVTSITDNGPGSITVTIDTDFSSASYVITTFGAGANSNQAQLNYVTSQSAGSFSADCINPNFTNVDPQTAWYFACFGDQ